MEGLGNLFSDNNHMIFTDFLKHRDVFEISLFLGGWLEYLDDINPDDISLLQSVFLDDERIDSESYGGTPRFTNDNSFHPNYPSSKRFKSRTPIPWLVLYPYLFKNFIDNLRIIIVG